MAFPDYIPDHLTPSNVPVAFTSIPEIERLLSYKGKYLHQDDLDITDDNYTQGTHVEANVSNQITELIQRVTSGIMEYLAPRYAPEILEKIPRIREIATYWACYKLTGRRGNEPLYEEEYAESLDTLERYREGSLYLDCPSRGPRAVVQSYVTDSRFYRNPVRVLATSSTSKVPGQNLALNYPFFWL